MEIDPRAFRNAMGCFATGVTVAAAMAQDGQPAGVTVSSFTSVSLTPPLVLFCLDKQTSCLEVFKKASHFALNVLTDGQRDLSNRFASKIADKWSGIAYHKTPSGQPALPECLAVYDCQREAVHEMGDHLVFVGRIVHLACDENRRPLVYFRGNYAEIG